MMANYKAGQTVEWTSTKRKGAKIQGVVLSGPSGKHAYYAVSTVTGQFKVPAAMLKPSKLPKAIVEMLEEVGAKFNECKEKNVAKREERQLENCLEHINFYKLHTGMFVQNRGVQGWPVVKIHSVDLKTGKCKVDTATRAIMDTARAFGWDKFGGTRRTRNTTHVLANRLFPV